MEIQVSKWGNSLGIRIPSNLLKTLDIKENDKLEINLEESKIIITKPKNKFSLKERFAAYKGPNLAKEFEWDEPRGREIW